MSDVRILAEQRRRCSYQLIGTKLSSTTLVSSSPTWTLVRPTATLTPPLCSSTDTHFTLVSIYIISFRSTPPVVLTMLGRQLPPPPPRRLLTQPACHRLQSTGLQGIHSFDQSRAHRAQWFGRCNTRCIHQGQSPRDGPVLSLDHKREGYSQGRWDGCGRLVTGECFRIRPLATFDEWIIS